MSANVRRQPARMPAGTRRRRLDCTARCAPSRQGCFVAPPLAVLASPGACSYVLHARSRPGRTNPNTHHRPEPAIVPSSVNLALCLPVQLLPRSRLRHLVKHWPYEVRDFLWGFKLARMTMWCRRSAPNRHRPGFCQWETPRSLVELFQTTRQGCRGKPYKSAGDFLTSSSGRTLQHNQGAP